MTAWQDLAWNAWRDERVGHLSASLRKMYGQFAPDMVDVWLKRMDSGSRPTGASAIKRWLSQLSGGLVAFLGDLQWDIAETSTGVLIAYPEPLGGDPLAMCGAVLLWVGNDVGRMGMAVNLIGAALVPALFSAKWEGPLNGALWESWIRGYHSHLTLLRADAMASWFESRSVVNAKWQWPTLPDFMEYTEQLRYGVVPHDRDGQSPRDPVAVLLALHQFEGEERLKIAGLAHKAIEGRLLADLWQQADDQGGHRLW